MVQADKEILNNDFEEISTKEIILKVQSWWRFLLSKWIIIILSGVLGGIMGITYATLQKTIYKAELSFALGEEKASGVNGASSLASQFGIDMGSSGGGSAFSGDNLMELMRSRVMVEKALLTPIQIKNKKITLAEFYINFNKLRDDWIGNQKLENIHFLPNKDRAKFTLSENSVLKSIYKSIITGNLVVDRVDKKVSLISLKVSAGNETFAKNFTEILAKVVSDFYIQTITKKEVQNVAILQRQYDSVRVKLNNSISGVASSIDAAPNANPLLQTLRVPSQRKQYDVQASTIILNELARNLETAKMSLLKEAPLIQIIDTPILPLDVIQVSKGKLAILGAVGGGVLAAFILIIIKIFKDIMS